MLPRDSEFASKYCTNERVTFSVDNKHLAISYSTLTYDQYGRVPFTRYVATVEVDSDRDAGKIIAFLVSRELLNYDRRSFHFHMNPVIVGTQCNFAHHLLDKSGRLKQRLHDTFGAETDQGDIMYIRNVILKKEYSKQKLACKALRKFLQVVCQDPEKPYAYQWWMAVMHSEACEDSWRPAGFRVIRGTCFLAACAKKGHKCRDEKQSDPPLLLESQPQHTGPHLRRAEMLRSMVCRTYTSVLGSAMQRSMSKVSPIQLLLMHYAAAAGSVEWLECLLKEGASVHEEDHAGNTPLHAAAHSGSPDAVQWLLYQKADRTKENRRGLTPLDVCALEMEYQRECSEARPEDFTHHENRYMLVIKHIVDNSSTCTGLISTLPYPRSKLGCTCGQCLQGFFSPRMRFRFVDSALTAYSHDQHVIDSTSKKFPLTTPKGSGFALEDMWQWQYIPGWLRRQENVNFIKGWIMFYGLISDMLGSEEMPVIVPTARSVRIAAEVLIEREQSGIASANAKYFSAYLSQGGRVEYVLDGIMGFVHLESEVTGGGNFIESDPRNKYRLQTLRACANDNDYNFLMRHLCDDGLIPDGPYEPPDPPLERVTDRLSSAFLDDNIRAYL